MTLSHAISTSALALGLCGAMFGLAPPLIASHAQPFAEGTSVGLFASEPRFFAPFSAKAVTKVVQHTVGVGRLERIFTAKYYRDAFGRVRVEYAPSSGGDGDGAGAAILVPNPYSLTTERVFLIDESAKQLGVMELDLAALLFDVTKGFAVPTALRRFTTFYTAERRAYQAGLFEDLGSEMIGGIQANGTRFTPSTLKAVDERWYSPELGLIVRAREIDEDLKWEIDYALIDVRRIDPPENLFVMPAGYQRTRSGGVLLESPVAELFRVHKIVR